MTNEWSELTDEKLARIAQEGLQGQGAPVEAMRRLRVFNAGLVTSHSTPPRPTCRLSRGGVFIRGFDNETSCRRRE